MNNKINTTTEEIVLQIPALGNEVIEISVAGAGAYDASSNEVKLIKNRCVEVSKNSNVSVLCLEF